MVSSSLGASVTLVTMETVDTSLLAVIRLLSSLFALSSLCSLLSLPSSEEDSFFSSFFDALFFFFLVFFSLPSSLEEVLALLASFLSKSLLLFCLALAALAFLRQFYNDMFINQKQLHRGINMYIYIIET